MEWPLAAVAVVFGCVAGWLISGARERARAERLIAEAEVKAGRAEAEAKAERERREAAESRRDQLGGELAVAQNALAEMRARAEETRKRLEEEKLLLAEAERKLADTFKSLAADTLRASTSDFLKIAEERFKANQEASARDFEARQKAIDEMVRPARESLARLDEEMRKIEAERRGSQGELVEQLRALGSQTTRLVDALKTPAVRGRWGEVQLRRVVEIAGMVEYCDFFEQEGRETNDGRIRPDMRVQLPGRRNVVVDSKVPLKAYLEALEADNEEQRALKLSEHASQVRAHIGQLASKSYWDACRPAPEFVVLFLPGEMFFSAALQQDPALIEDAAQKKVILATPTTLIALLKAVAYGWRQEQIAENAERISVLGRELHERIATMSEHFERLGQALSRAVEAYNQALGSVESRVLVTTRRFKELGVASKKEIPELSAIEMAPREPSSVLPGDSEKS
jgi:DNA recombination protein RmuC